MRVSTYAAPPGPWTPGRPAVVGHRGARGLIPENTVASMRAAIDVGVPAIELDVLLTADDQVVVWHDPVLHPAKCRPTGADYLGARVDELTLTQLRTVDVGSLTLAGFPRQRAVPGERIPTLAEVFAATTDAPIWWVIEVKIDVTDPRDRAARHTLLDGVLTAVTDAGVRDRVFIHSFDWAVLEQARELDPQLPRSALAVVGETFAPGSEWLGSVRWEDHPNDLVGAVAELGAVLVSPDFHSCTAELVEQAHARGMAVLPWTVNDPVIFGDLADIGADGVVTDLPDEMLAL
ncbi:MAG: glycerophosphodiester phosphodiesterase [Actinomycetales bacterium]|uniref:Glycerophosphodiester phosphodiesterase n=1 Tax=Candidatus Phosphoribacter hodrii TaxID=2953743 RepID=A0A9D7Y057_9MICO|nr:glycerophosphodiester phosphodiesterase [Candidatus Phosphoribacter hodrii]